MEDFGRMEVEVLDTYKFEDSNREAYRGRGSPLQKQTIQDKKRERRLLGKFFSLFREFNLQRLQSVHEDLKDEEEMKRQSRMKTMKDTTKKTKSRGMMDARTDGGLLNCWRQTVREYGSIHKRKKPCKNGMLGWRI